MPSSSSSSPFSSRSYSSHTATNNNTNTNRRPASPRTPPPDNSTSDNASLFYHDAAYSSSSHAASVTPYYYHNDSSSRRVPAAAAVSPTIRAFELKEDNIRGSSPSPSIFSCYFCCLFCFGNRRKKKTSQQEKLPLLLKTPKSENRIGYDAGVKSGHHSMHDSSFGSPGKQYHTGSQRLQSVNDRRQILDKWIDMIYKKDWDALKGHLNGGIDITEWNKMIQAASLHSSEERIELAQMLLPRLYTEVEHDRIVLAGLTQDEQEFFNQFYDEQCKLREEKFNRFVEQVSQYHFESDKVRFLYWYFGATGRECDIIDDNIAHGSTRNFENDSVQDEDSDTSSTPTAPFIAITCKDFLSLLQLYTFSHDKIEVTRFMLPYVIDLKLHGELILREFKFAEDRSVVTDMMRNILQKALD